jgi:hypothetical protein
MRFIVITAALLTLVGCQSATRSPEVSLQSTWQMITEHIRIDDEVIDKGDPWAVIEPVWWTGNIYDGEAEYEKSLARFSKEQRFLLAVNWYVTEVNNGGHEQFYYNSTGIVWKDALAGFREMGLDEAAAILEESAERLGGNPSLDRERRWEQMDAHEPTFDDLDDRFYDLEDTIDLDAVMQEYIVQHREAFYYEGDVTKPKSLNYSQED